MFNSKDVYTTSYNPQMVGCHPVEVCYNIRVPLGGVQFK